MMEVETVAFLGLLSGVMSLVALPYLRKMYQGTIKHFEMRYILIAVASLFMSLMVAFQMVPELVIPENAVSWLKVFSANFFVGMGAKAAVAEIFAWGKPPEEETKSPVK